MKRSVREKPFELTASLEDYLEAIKELIDAGPHGHAHTSEIARRLGVKMPSVTNAMGILCQNGYINYDLSKPITLTAKGRRTAERVIHRHRVLKTFLNAVLLLPEKEASEVACKVEHILGDALVERLDILNKTLADAASAPILERLTTLLQQDSETL